MNHSNLGSFVLPPNPVGSAMARSTSAIPVAVAVLLSLAACGFPRPRELPSDSGDGVSDTPDTSFVLHVSPSGDDANDGFMQPVKTLKHAIGLAAADTRVTTIALASGTYSASSGEAFPYTVPPNVTIAGPAGAGAVIAGMKLEPGITVDTGGLQDLDLQDFATAITVTGNATLRNIRISASSVAVQAEATSDVVIDHGDIAGSGSCETGVILNGNARLAVTTLATRRLGKTLDARDQSTSTLSNLTIAGDESCTPGSLLIKSNRQFEISDSLLDGGYSGIVLSPARASPALKAVIVNTIIRAVRSNALEGAGFSRDSIILDMTGGELSNTRASGADLIAGTWNLKNVVIKQNMGTGIYLQTGILKMRGSSVIDSGVAVSDDATADLGTPEDPGDNTLQSIESSGLSLVGTSGAQLIKAVGNVWRPNIQGADSTGKYHQSATIVGPVSFVRGNNYTLLSGWSLLL